MPVRLVARDVVLGEEEVRDELERTGEEAAVEQERVEQQDRPVGGQDPQRAVDGVAANRRGRLAADDRGG